MNTRLNRFSSLSRAAWLLPLALFFGCPSSSDGHEGHEHDGHGHEAGEHEEVHQETEGHEGHDHEGSK